MGNWSFKTREYQELASSPSLKDKVFYTIVTKIEYIIYFNFKLLYEGVIFETRRWDY